MFIHQAVMRFGARYAHYIYNIILQESYQRVCWLCAEISECVHIALSQPSL